MIAYARIFRGSSSHKLEQKGSTNLSLDKM